MTIGGTSWCPTIPIYSDILDGIDRMESIEDPIQKALEYFCFLARGQFFPDGNKRVAQLMANKALIEEGIGIFQIPINSLEEFKTLLLNFYESNNSIPLIQFMKQFCIIQPNKVPAKYEDSLDVENIKPQEITLSVETLRRFEKVLSRLRRLCLEEGLSGEYSLLKRNNNIIFSAEDFSCTITPEEASNLLQSKSKTVSTFVVKTVDLLCRSFKIPIKQINFPSGVTSFKSGSIYYSDEEEGSIVITLM